VIVENSSADNPPINSFLFQYRSEAAANSRKGILLLFYSSASLRNASYDDILFTLFEPELCSAMNAPYKI
jgi:hypothetical protein